MRTTITIILLVVLAWNLYFGFSDQDDVAVAKLPEHVTIEVSESAIEVVEQSFEADVLPIDAEGVLEGGEAEIQEIGEFLDPEQIAHDNDDVTHIGDEIDIERVITVPSSLEEPINIGGPLDPDADPIDPPTSGEIQDIGELLDPEA